MFVSFSQDKMQALLPDFKLMKFTNLEAKLPLCPSGGHLEGIGHFSILYYYIAKMT